ncbi:hypothetical protein B0H10DRAFT_2006812, partial [Mycena sp. CBHHK59/15]
MARAPTRDHPSGPQHAHQRSCVLDALDGFLPRLDPPVSQPPPKRGTIAACGTGLQRLPLTPDSPPFRAAALPKGLPVRPGSPLSVAPPKQAKARLIFWFEDNTPPVHARVLIHRGLVRLHENKRILGDINLEMHEDSEVHAQREGGFMERLELEHSYVYDTPEHNNVAASRSRAAGPMAPVWGTLL